MGPWSGGLVGRLGCEAWLEDLVGHEAWLDFLVRLGWNTWLEGLVTRLG